MKRRFIQLVPIVVLLAGIGFLVVHEVQYARRVTPRTDGMDLQSFIVDHPEVRGVYEVRNRSGAVYFVVLGNPDRGMALPSGPPAYVFDEQLVMVDWRADSGETDDDFAIQWLTPMFDAPERTIEELLRDGE